jgi:hypothetical protein
LIPISKFKSYAPSVPVLQHLTDVISTGNEQAITQFIRLSSLSGMTGTFTKIGLTGLPLATIFLTILLGIMGLANPQFFDLAKLTLGAKDGQILVSSRIAEAVETVVKLEDLGELELRGLRRPVAAFNVVQNALNGGASAGTR